MFPVMLFVVLKVRDPYRWLEDPDAKEVEEWVEAQNKTTDKYFERLETDKQKFTKRMTELVGPKSMTT
eukprot:46035-Eustigmatos_ZCMA.PRE.1